MHRNSLHLLALALFATTSYAQSSSGSLHGVVQDATFARVVAATIRIHPSGTSLSRTVSSNVRGEFQLRELAPGPYEVRVEARGFEPAAAAVSIQLGTQREITVTLAPTSVHQTVGVQARSSSITEQPIDLSGNVLQSVITASDLQQLPLPAPSFANVAYLAPGTEPVEPSDPTKARITAVSTGGSSGLNNELSVDGGDDSDDYIGGFLQNVSPDAIREFVIRTAEENADTGGTTAGSVLITTRSGTNQWHGLAAVYERSAALTARYPIDNPAPNPKQPFSRQNYVATLGGPILRDELWFYSAFEAIREDASIAYSPANLVQFNALATLATQGLIAGVPSIVVPNSTPVPFRDYLGSMRLDWTQSARSQWFLRDAIDNYTTHNDLVQQGTLPSTGLLAHNNYLSMVVANHFAFTPNLLGQFLVNAGGLHLTQARNSHLGFALAFPFSSTAATISGFETFGDNQFATPITFFPATRNQQKYQLRYDLSYARTSHALQLGFNFIHEPVLDGSFPNQPETLYQLPLNPTDYVGNPAQFMADLLAGASNTTLGGGFAQNVQRLALYAEDSWRIGRSVTLNYGLRYSTTFGLFTGSGRSQLQNKGYLTLQALDIPLVSGAPHDDRKQFGPRIGVVVSPGANTDTVLRASFGLYYEDLAQNGWVTALQALGQVPGPCVAPVLASNDPQNIGCVPGSSLGGTAGLIDPAYRTPYAIHASIGLEHAFTPSWLLGADLLHEQGNHGYRAYNYTGGRNLFTPLLAAADPNQANVVPNVQVFHSDNRSSYTALLLHLQGNLSGGFNLIANYTFAKAQTWGCTLGEIFDYVNGVCDPLQPFAPGDYGPSGEDVRHRVVLAGTLHLPGRLNLSGLCQAETARPFTITTADNSARIAINGVTTSLDQFRGTPYIQTDLRVSRPIALSSARAGDDWSITPFVEFFNIFNRNNPGANYVTNIASLPVPASQAQSGDISSICTNAACNSTLPLSSPVALRVPAGALGDFFGPGTTVGIPFSAQFGVRLSF